MKIKTLLIAAGALAAGVISSQAQVYSQNIVGYANLSTPFGGTYLVTVPFKIGSSNGANEVYPLVGGVPTIPDFSTVLIWTGSGYTAYQSDEFSSSLWDDGNGNPIPNAPILPVGSGYFLIPAGSTTNSYVGVVAINVGTSNNMVLPFGGTYLVSPVVPYAGSVTNGTAQGGGPALSSNNGLPDFSTILIWNGSGYAEYQSDSQSSSLWDDGNGNPIANAPTLNVGQSFFIIPSADFTWTVGL